MVERGKEDDKNGTNDMTGSRKIFNVSKLVDLLSLIRK